MRTYRHTGFDDTREHAGPDWQNLVVEHVAWIVHRHRAVMSDPEIGTRNRLHHVGKVLAAHLGRGAREHLGRIDHRARDLLDHLRLLLLVDEHTEGVANVDLDFDLEGGRHAGAERAHALADQRAHFVGEGTHRAAEP